MCLCINYLSIFLFVRFALFILQLVSACHFLLSGCQVVPTMSVVVEFLVLSARKACSSSPQYCNQCVLRSTSPTAGCNGQTNCSLSCSTQVVPQVTRRLPRGHRPLLHSLDFPCSDEVCQCSPHLSELSLLSLRWELLWACREEEEVWCAVILYLLVLAVDDDSFGCYGARKKALSKPAVSWCQGWSCQLQEVSPCRH